MLTGDKATWKSVVPDHPFDPAKGQWGAFDIVARIGSLRVVGNAPFDAGFADSTRSARRVYSAGVGVNWYANKNVRFVLDYERTWFTLGASDGTIAVDRPVESGFVGRVQMAF